MGDWLQNNINCCYPWPSCFYLEHTEEETNGWDARNSSDICLPQQPCKGIYICIHRIHPFIEPIFFGLLSLGQSNIGKKKQEKWVKNLYISSICYGRTVCWQLCQSSKVKALEFPVEAEDLRDGSRNKLPHIASDCKWLAWPLFAISYSSLVVKDHLFAMLYQMWTLPTS